VTLEAVAAEAGVSKGGLLYHFPTKDALLEALVQDWLDRFEADVEAEAGELGWARAYTRAAAAWPSSAEQHATDAAFTLAVASGPQGLEAVQRG
jgi:AcrR family transcriptional regulator